jgi:hypothetical protein
VEVFCGIKENKTFVVTAKTQFPVQVDKSHLFGHLNNIVAILCGCKKGQ